MTFLKGYFKLLLWRRHNYLDWHHILSLDFEIEFPLLNWSTVLKWTENTKLKSKTIRQDTVSNQTYPLPPKKNILTKYMQVGCRTTIQWAGLTACFFHWGKKPHVEMYSNKDLVPSRRKYIDLLMAVLTSSVAI